MNLPEERKAHCDLDTSGRCELDENLEIFSRVPVFSGIPAQRLRVYAYLSRRAHYSPGEFLFRQGDRDNKGYIVISGRVQMIREYREHSLILKEIQEGEFFGGLALLSDIRRLFSARAMDPLDCLTVDRESFQKLVVQFPEVAINSIDIMIRRIVEMEEKLLETKIQECVYG